MRMSYDDRKYIKAAFESEIERYSYKEHIINSKNSIYYIEDSLLLLVSFVPNYREEYESTEEYLLNYDTFRYLDGKYSGENYHSFKIEEITPNQIQFEYNTTKWVERVYERISEEVFVYYEKFQGYKRKYWCDHIETTAEHINRVFPELNIRSWYEAWEGIKYNFIIYEAIASNGEKHYAVDYTRRFPLVYVNQACKTYIKSGSLGERGRRGFYEALRSWKRHNRQRRVEEHVTYQIVSKSFREKDDVWRYADKLVDKAYNGELSGLDKLTYTHPKNKWVSEEQVYNWVCKLYGKRNVIYQHRPAYLKSSLGGQMSYDIFIIGKNIAIEYQGKQHFEPVDFFGGQKAFEELQRRDKEKLQLSKANGVKLVYINYWEEITQDLIQTRIEG